MRDIERSRSKPGHEDQSGRRGTAEVRGADRRRATRRAAPAVSLSRPSHRLPAAGLSRKPDWASRPNPLHEHPHAVGRRPNSSRRRGMHTISIFTQYFPYTLAEGTWEERRDEIAEHVIDEFARYAPNIPGAIVGMQVLSPPDIEARFWPNRRPHLPWRARAGAGLRHAARCQDPQLRRPARRACSCADRAPGRAVALWARPATMPRRKSSAVFRDVGLPA